VLALVAEYVPKREDYIVDCQLAFQFGLPGENDEICATRDRTNLEFFPDGAVFSCGMLVEDPAVSGYLWDGVLRRRSGTTEISLTQETCAGCPVRTLVPEYRGADSSYVPLCIYSRLSR
jgi:hypothetical protein